MNATRAICADCMVYAELVNDACKPCLEQRRLVFCERNMLRSLTDDDRESWAGHYRRIAARNTP